MADEKKAFSWDEEDKRQAANPAPAKSGFTWSDADGAATAQPATPAPKTPGIGERLTRSYNPDVEQFAEKHPIAGPAVRFLDAAGGAAMAAPGAALSAIRHPLDTVKGVGESLAAWKDPNTWKGAASVLPEALGQGVGNVAVGEGLKPISSAAADATGASRTALSRIARDPATGKIHSPWEIAVDKLLPDPNAPKAIPARQIPKGTNYGQFLEDQKNAPKVEPALGSPENPGFHSKLPTRMPPKVEPVAEPAALGSVENPGWHSKIPTRMPRTSDSPEPPPAGGPGLPKAQVVKLPVPREPLPTDNPGYMASIPRSRLMDLGRQGRPGAGQQLQNIGKTPLYVPEGGYAPPKSVESLEHVGGSRITLNPVGKTGARPLAANQFESSFGPEYKEVGDLAEWETGHREGLRPRKVLVP